MVINDIFYSIQGEGRYAGIPAIFVRVQGCSLHCPWCDSAGTWAKAGDEKDLSPRQLVARLQNSMHANCKTVIITGGEPTEQKDLYAATEELKCEGYKVHLETNGSSDIVAGYFNWVVCSPKPGLNYAIPKGVDELKFVIEAGDDLRRIVEPAIRSKFEGRIWLQPKADGDRIIKANVDYCIAQVLRDPRLRLGFQLHKLVGVK